LPSLRGSVCGSTSVMVALMLMMRWTAWPMRARSFSSD
jgi:hypothetical protein